MDTTHKDTDKRTAILNATLDLIAERGFHNAPVSQVAKRSGVSAGIIYHYFDNKDALIHALYAHIKSRYAAALMAGDPGALAWPDRLRRLWHNAYDFYVAHPHETAFIEQYENSPYHTTWEDAGLLDDENMGRLGAMIAHEMAAGRLISVPFEVLYDLTLGVARQLAKRHINGTLDMTADLLDISAEACLQAVTPSA